MHGCGNDYIYIDCFREDVSNPSELAVRFSNRHTGIGSDGLVLIMPSERANLRMRMFNADGTEAQMCGNASRCVARYAYEHGLVTTTDMTLETLAGIRQLHIHLRDNKVYAVSVNMGKAQVTGEMKHKGLRIITIDIGNPHAVVFVEDLSKTDVPGLGSEIETLPCFPNRTNVEFAQIISSNEIRMQVWERGTGETMACGTGACAVAFAAFSDNKTLPDTTLHLSGGDLQVSIKQTGEILMTGPAEEVFSGTIKI